VSVVLIEPQFATSNGLPVLSRNITAQAGPTPQLIEAVPPTGQVAAAAGDTVTVSGKSLSGANRVGLVHQHLGIEYKPFPPSRVTGTTASFTVPTDAANLPAGLYNLAMLFVDVGGRVVQSTNSVSISLAPTLSAPTVVPNAEGFLVTVNCVPDVLPNQSASLALGATAVPA